MITQSFYSTNKILLLEVFWNKAGLKLSKLFRVRPEILEIPEQVAQEFTLSPQHNASNLCQKSTEAGLAQNLKRTSMEAR
jgi:hypothetical protein